jgi:putative transferase (TIGR04331 family)
VLGNAIDAGERVMPAQHGGTYGWGDALSISAECDYAHDSFISWGWTDQQEYAGRFVPLPSPLLSRNLGKPTGANGDIVMIGHAMRAFNPRLDFVPCSLEYRRRKPRFIGALLPEVAARLRYRPYHLPETFEDSTWLNGIYPRLPIVEGLLDEAMLAAKLVVLDHPGTTLAISLAANIPTVACWDRDLWPLARQAEPLFNQLEDAGILFGEPEAAAAQVNAVWPRVQDWWNEPGRQEVRRAWCHRFARASTHWQFDWLTKLSSI